MQHVERCEECSGFWNELQAAQRLVLLLPRERVSEGFRDQLWDRIRSGEGTPEAVFHEPVPLMTKVRYALTGAAAAAAVLFFVIWLRPPGSTPNEAHVADVERQNVERLGVERQGSAIAGSIDMRNVPPVDVQRDTVSDDVVRFEDSPLMASARLLTTDVFALETARQLEQRHASAQLALRRLGDKTPDSDPAVEQALTNANEFRTFGECLLDLRESHQLLFVDPAVEADLRFAVSLLAQDHLHRAGAATVRSVVAPALQSSRLGRLSKSISLVPRTMHEEHEVLVRLNALRPEVFPMLFFVFGSDDELQGDLLRRGQAFRLDDPCGPSWVAPRSEVEARDLWLRTTRRAGATPGQMEVRIQVQRTN